MPSNRNDEISEEDIAGSPKKRLMSLDALRGFTMFWIVGGDRIAILFLQLVYGVKANSAIQQFHHCRWDGLRLIDLIFPMFVFMTGATLGLSKTPFRELAQNVRRKKYVHAVIRLLFMIALCAVFNRACGWGDFMSFNGPRYTGVLTRIAIAWFFCAMIVWHLRVQWQLVTAIGIVIFYWAVQTMFGDYTPAGCINLKIDQCCLPGFILGHKMDPENLLSHLPAVANALFGALAAGLLVTGLSCRKKTAILVTIGFIMVGLAWWWNPTCPINKRLWTSSYVLVTSGWSMVLLGLFYITIDCWKHGKYIGLPWAVIGANALFVYLLHGFVNLHYSADKIFGGFIAWAPSEWHALLTAVCVVTIEWILLALLYRRRIFIRI
jgi:predicted acyltransferase